ncbi:MAG: redox-sensing transcriptional repressor Rex [Aggregatilineales bacterium]
MTAINNIPDIVIGRLPIYLRALSQLADEGKSVTSSHELGERLGISSAQIRKDLSHFGEFGKQGTGYQIAHLFGQLRQILQIDREWPVAVIGIGDLGRALARYGGFVDRGFRIVAVFDNDPAKIGTSLDNLTILPDDRIVDEIKAQNIKVAMIAVPAPHAQAVCSKLVTAGVRAILNYAPITLTVPSTVHVQYIDPVAHLQHMTYYLTPN